MIAITWYFSLASYFIFSEISRCFETRFQTTNKVCTYIHNVYSRLSDKKKYDTIVYYIYIDVCFFQHLVFFSYLQYNLMCVNKDNDKIFNRKGKSNSFFFYSEVLIAYLHEFSYFFLLRVCQSHFGKCWRTICISKYY